MPAQERKVKFSAEHFESLSPRDRIESLLAFGEPPAQQRLTSQFVRECKLKSIDILSPKSAKAVFTFKVARFYCNATGNLHGGASSMIFDLCTSLPVMALGKKDFWLNAGVSRTLIVNYLRPAPEGMELELEAEVISLGKNLAYTRGLLKRAEDGVIVATCEHTKAAVPSKPSWKL